MSPGVSRRDGQVTRLGARGTTLCTAATAAAVVAAHSKNDTSKNKRPRISCRHTYRSGGRWSPQTAVPTIATHSSPPLFATQNLLGSHHCSITGPRRRRWRGRRSTRGAADGGGSVAPTRSGTGGAGTAGPPGSAGASPRRGAPCPDARRGVRVAAAGGRSRRQPTGRHAAVAARCSRNGHSPSSIMFASGDFIRMEGFICIGW